MNMRIRGIVATGIGVLIAAGAMGAAEPDLRVVQAAADKDRAAVRALLAKKADVNAARADGATALMWAAHWDDLEMADLLLRAGAKVNAADDYGVTALARASENASEAMVGRLLEAGADPNAAQKSGLTPLMIASRTGNAKVVKALIAKRRERQRHDRRDERDGAHVGARDGPFGDHHARSSKAAPTSRPRRPRVSRRSCSRPATATSTSPGC